MRVLAAEDVRRALPMADAIAGMKEAFGRLAAGEADVPLRSRVQVPRRGATALFMPAYLAGSDDLALKVVSVFPGNPALGLPMLHAAVLVLAADTGRLLALLEGAALTAIRTGAASGAATDLLARPDARTVAIIGSGAQARTQLAAVCTVRDIHAVTVFSPTAGHAAAFAAAMAGKGPIPAQVRPVSDPDEAVAGADIVCAATTSTTPVFDGRRLRPGTHVNGVGSFTPAMCEIDLVTIQRARVVVDQREAMAAEAGELIHALQTGALTAGAVTTLGEIINGHAPARQSADEITFFKSVGVAVQDLVAARIALAHAQAADLGRTVPFD